MDTRREQLVLKQSIWATIGIVIAGIVIGLWSGSQSIVFDGAFSAIDGVMCAVALFVSKLVMQEGSRRFQHGYWHLEPLVAAMNGGLLTLVCCYAFLNGLLAFIEGGHLLKFGLAISYAGVTSFVCLLMYVYTWKMARRMQSEFLRIDANSWLISLAISLAILISFLIAVLFSGTRFEHLVPYADPLLLMLLTLCLVPLPIHIVWKAVREILLIAPADLDARVRHAARDVTLRYGFQTYRTYVAKTGRIHFIEIHFVTPPDFAEEKGVGKLDQIRQEIIDQIGQDELERWFTVSFTADERWL